MKRSPGSPPNRIGARAGSLILLASLLAAASAVAPAAATTTAEPTATSTGAASPAPTESVPVSTKPSPSSLPDAPLPVPEPSGDPTATASREPASTQGPPDMGSAVGPGGAEMGQRSARVTEASKQDAAVERFSMSQADGGEGTWSPTIGVRGMDVSGHQPYVNWREQWNMGARFAYVKATEGSYFTSDTFSSQYQGSRSVGMLRGAYHFAIPNWSSGAEQARYFVQHGGGWSADGYTLPPVLDFEFNPYAGRTINGFYFGNDCYGMSPSQLTSWVRDFGNTVRSLTGRLPVIYTNTHWWQKCLADPVGFGDYPLWLAAYPYYPTNSPGAIPKSWTGYNFWQYSSKGPFAGDSNIWNGDLASLQRFAKGITVYTSGAIGSAWLAAGGNEGLFGYPTSNEVCTPSYCVQTFQRRAAYWTAANGVRTVFLPGAIGQSWNAAGGTSSSWGLAVDNERCVSNFCYQTFEKRTAYWTAAYGVRTVYTPGAVGQTWLRAGGTNSDWGMAISDEQCFTGYCLQDFERRTAYWTPDRGVLTIYKPGAIGSVWRSQGGTSSAWGMPTTNETCSSATLCTQRFQYRTATWTPTGGVRIT